jgi:3-dehydroquinate dehydratase|tara:strand:- start:511 stop:837 length:327 start_codon:yes stop_codon:yes gene_type:complete
MNELEENNLTDWLTESEKMFMRNVGKYNHTRKASTSDLLRRKLHDKIRGALAKKVREHNYAIVTVHLANSELKEAFRDRCGAMPMSRVLKWLMVKYIEGDYGNYEQNN